MTDDSRTTPSDPPPDVGSPAPPNEPPTDVSAARAASGSSSALEDAAIEEGAMEEGPVEEGPVEIVEGEPSGSAPAMGGGFGVRPPLLGEHQKTVISKQPPVVEPFPPLASTPREIGRILEGETLGHFRLEQFVGGGMGAVFRAADQMLGRTVAVKVLSRDQTDEETLRRFKNEAQSAARLDHENIARVYYVGEERGWHYIVFEFIEGENVRDLVERKGPLGLEEALGYVLQVAEALDHAFRRDVVHRDIKPSNILVPPSGRAKLVDMGLARLHQVENSQDDLTASGMTLGTFDYISPEQARNPRSADVRSDLYSLGCTFYYMLTGRPPFPEGTVLQKLLSHSSDPPPDIRLHRPDLPEEVGVVLNKMLAKQRDQRYQDPSELVGELLLLAESLGLPTAQRGAVWVSSEEPRSAWFERHAPWIVPTALLLLVVALLEWRSADQPYGFPPVDAPPRLTTRASDTSAAAPQPEPQPIVAPAEGDAVEDDSNTASQEASPPANDSSQREDTVPMPSPSPAPVAPTTPIAEQSSENSDPPLSAEDENGADVSSTAPSESEEPYAAFPPGEEAGDLQHWLDETFGQDASFGPPEESGELTGAGEAVAAAVSLDDAGEELTAAEGPFSPEPDAEEPVSLLLVGGDELNPPTGGEAVGSLAEAFARAGELADASVERNEPLEELTIELHADLIVEEAFEVSLDAPVKVRAAASRRPLVVFRPSASAVAKNRRMIRIDGGEPARLRWEGVDLWMALPSEPSDGWAMFEARDLSSLEFRDCTLTLQNESYSTASFFHLPEQSSEEESFQERPPTIVLTQCIARGQATLVNVERARPFSLLWEQGLFASTETMIQVEGAVRKPRGLVPIEVDLDHVTVRAPGGMCQMTRGDDAPVQIGLSVNLSHCIFLTDHNQPLIWCEASADDSAMRPPLEIRGEENIYPFTNIGLRRESDYDFEQLQDSQPPSVLYKQSGVQSMLSIMWENEPPIDLEVHRYEKQHYVLSKEPGNRAMRGDAPGAMIGFDPSLLPAAPAPPSDSEMDSTIASESE